MHAQCPSRVTKQRKNKFVHECIFTKYRDVDIRLWVSEETGRVTRIRSITKIINNMNTVLKYDVKIIVNFI